MKTRWPEIAAILFLHLGMFTASAQSLAIRATANKTTQITWASGLTDLVLEEASAIGPSALWRPVAQPPVLANNQYSVTVDASGGARFFRLHSGALAPLTTIRESSPADGETGVAVTRETIVHFSQPLADTTVLTATNFYATFGGRRILSRIELGTDRRKATLFYLEPLPGGARINVFFDAEGVKDFMGRPIDPAGTDQPNGFKLIQFDTLSLTPLTATAVIGRVFASELVPGSDTGANAVNKPLAGVTITVDGMEQTLRTTTDAQGNFTLSPVPPGRFFVHIDGRTVTDAAAGVHYPDKSYYPSVGKAWDAVAGRTNNLAGGTGNIYLPLIKAGTLQPVSMAQDTTISFPSNITADNPALAGVSITVPANSLFSDDGTRGGKVGIAPVPPDRLPGPLPPGLELPIVITVQTDGPLNFDRPAPVCFPNLPDPVLGVPLPAGSKQALISFNHKKGVWEGVGSMTVSADGKLICTDPGVGILQPGWHGVAPKPAEPEPEPEPEPECKPDNALLTKCFELCESTKGDCLYGVDILQFHRLRRCDDLFAIDADKKDHSACLDEAWSIYADEQKLCIAQWGECGKGCKQCHGHFPAPPPPEPKEPEPEPEPPAPPPPALSTSSVSRQSISTRTAGKHSRLHSLAAADRIRELLDQAFNLLLPFVENDSPVPESVLEQVQSLHREAEVLAGGDLLEFYVQTLLKREQERPVRDSIADAGNAPDYPVFYAAEILRPSGFLHLRGETEPFGEYSIFAPRAGTLLRVLFYDPRTKRAALIVPYQDTQAAYALPRFMLAPLDGTERDADQDGLPDVVEFVYGTNPRQPDSDSDGIPDGAEVEQGTNPLDGLAVRTGIIATTQTPGPAIDVWAGNDLVATAEGTAGISVFNAYRGVNPTMIVHLPMPGNAQRVSGTGNFLAVAAGDAGLCVVDVTDPATARIVHQVPMTGAQAVVAAAGKAYVGLASGDIAVVDLATGVVLNQLSVASAVWDLALEGDHLFALIDTELRVYQLTEAGLLFTGAGPTSNFQADGITRVKRLFVGGGHGYVTSYPGYDVFDVRNPAALARVGAAQDGGPNSFKQIVLNGSGIGVAAVGVNPRLDGTHDVYVYDVSNPAVTTAFLTLVPTPGLARAVAIYNGLVYGADDAGGLQVINYLPYDANGVPPTVALSTSFPAGGPVVERASVHVTANVGDDVQVRHVEFYLDGVKVFSDGNFPFEHRFDAPALAGPKTTFTLQARAVDTGGNATLSAEMVVVLLPDTTPARITATAPVGGAKALNRIHAFFSEPMDPSSVNAASFQLISVGADGLLETGDDVLVGGGVVSYRLDSKAATLELASPLPDGLYRAVVKSAVADLAGNRLAADYAWAFRVADAVFWTRNVDGFWDNPLNWASGAVPGAGDHVVIDAFGADVTVTLDGGSIQGGTVTQNGGAKLRFTNRSGTLDGVTVNGDLVLTNAGASLLIRNGLTLNGTVLLDNGAAIGFLGDQSFDIGSVVFAGNSGSLNVEGSATLTLGPAMVVRGKSGFIGGSGFPKLINRGLIATDVAGGALTIGTREFENAGTIQAKDGNSLTFSGVNWSNAGRIEVASGGTLTLNGAWTNRGTINLTEAKLSLGGRFTLAGLGTIERVGGTVELTSELDLNGGTLTLDARTGPWVLSGTIKRGTVTQTGAAKLIFTNRGATFDGVSVNGDLELTSLGARLLIRNGLTLAGTVTLDNGSALLFAGDQTFNAGIVIFVGNSGSPGWLSIEGNTTLTLGPAVVVRGKTGRIGTGLFQPPGTNKLINQGLISADVAGGALTVSLDQFENTGTIAATAAGSTITVRANPFTNTGTIRELNGGKVLINP